MSTIVVAGGGAAGLGAALTLLEGGHKVVLIDANPDLGGRCRTHMWQGEWIIRGAAAFIGGEDEIITLCRKLGIYHEEDILSSSEEMEFTVCHPKLGYSFLGGFDAPSILKSEVIPLMEKARLGMALPKMIKAFVSADERNPTSVVAMDDINACEYFRSYSPAFVDYILEPVMNQYCGYSEHDYSMAWLGWLMASPRSWSASQWTFPDRGVGRVTHAIEAWLAADPDCTLHKDALVTRIDRRDEGVRVTFDSNGQTSEIVADGVIVAVPGSKVPAIMPDLPPAHAAFFDEVEYIAHHIIHAIIDKPAEDVPFSLLLPTCEGYQACSNIWIKTLPDRPDKLMFYGEVKGAFCREHANRDDAFFMDAIWADACRAVPVLATCGRHDFHVQRNEIGLCSRRKGYTTALKAFRSLPPLPGVRFAGDYLINSTVGQSLRSGIDAAEALIGAMAEGSAPAALPA